MEGANKKLFKAPPARITLKDLARELGFSIPAVSQALNPRENTSRLSPATAEKIRKFAQEKNYRPDSRAKSMRQGRFYNLGYLEARTDPTAWSIRGADSGIADVASENHYRMVHVSLPSNVKDNSSFIPSAFREGNLDALIVSHAGKLSTEVEEAIDTSGFPVVYLNEKKRYNAVYVDEKSSAEELTQHLISSGKQRILYFHSTVKEDHYSKLERQRGYRHAMNKAGLPCSFLEIDEPDHAGAKRTVKKSVLEDHSWTTNKELAQWFQAHPEIEAVIAYDDFMAIYLARAFYNGPGVPKNLVVASLGGQFAPLSPMGLLVMENPYYEMARAAAEMALTLINTPQESLPAHIFRANLRTSGFGV